MVCFHLCIDLHTKIYSKSFITMIKMDDFHIVGSCLSEKWEYALISPRVPPLLYLFIYLLISAVLTKQGCREGCEQWGWMCYHSNKLTHWQDCTILLSHRGLAADVANELWSFPAFGVARRLDTPVRGRDVPASSDKGGWWWWRWSWLLHILIV